MKPKIRLKMPEKSGQHNFSRKNVWNISSCEVTSILETFEPIIPLCPDSPQIF
jgi:hypothetical protein